LSDCESKIESQALDWLAQYCDNTDLMCEKALVYIGEIYPGSYGPNSFIGYYFKKHRILPEEIEIQDIYRDVKVVAHYFLIFLILETSNENV
jgi:hypothetical protein